MQRLYRRSGFNALPMIALGFLGIILLGSLLLALPVASATGVPVPWFDTLFTATSAVCVTGLVVRDTGTAYSTFGHVVLLVLIQLGGLGFMTFATLIFRVMGRSISMRERMIMQDSLNEDDMGGMVQPDLLGGPQRLHGGARGRAAVRHTADPHVRSGQGRVLRGVPLGVRLLQRRL